ncbi:pyridine nucleotide-disulfide oxidoreductase [Erysipelothrix larvae]|uniref:NADH:ubiquinone reductase (non-electrogenic) n=1 Tax=Erysipelothrix larvae TaxID=1514105 RepID=A0A0X8GYV4_9FIRM|nr:FAD-dependent oxidoreductase [Erysipelothrix larvae]AMC92937.1 pyridine nucleotide-disulfide oxidoreductase [Erysipelothrix larvae]
MGTKIVVVGAGYAGVLTAKKLAKKFKKNSDVQVTIIDKNPFHTMLTELHEVAACRVDEESIRMDLKKIFAGRRVDVKLDTVETVDFDAKKVVGKHETYDYDYVVIASGSKPTYFGVPGAKENSFTLWSYDDAVILRDHIHNTFHAASCEPDLAKRRKMLTFHVVGAGFTGVEMMGELAEYVPVLCHKLSLDPSDVTMVNLDGMNRVVPILPEKLSAKVERRLAKMGVRVELNAMVKEVGADFVVYERDGKQVREETTTTIWTAGIEQNDVASDSGKSLEAAQRGGRIETDGFLRAKGREDVYVVGDNMYYIVEGEDRPVPQMVENAEHSAGTAANNIAESIRGGNNLKTYKPAFHGVMVCIGGKYGVAHVGLPNFMFSLPSFFAMFAKHFINIVYFIQVMGWTKIFSYLKHEFFTIRNQRSFVGGHLSNRTPSFLLMPVRVWLGAVWLFEGLYKWLAEGWLEEFKLPDFFKYANMFYDNIIDSATAAYYHVGTEVALKGSDMISAATGDAGSGATGDAASGATGAGGGTASAGELLFNVRFFNVFHLIFVSSTALESAKLENYAFKLNVPLMNWFVENVILANPDFGMIMQVSIVIMEILVGLALIAGLFTTLSAGVSIVLQLMFLMTTGWYLSGAWMFFASFAVLIGGGRTLGLDYWVMPWLKKQWTKIPFFKKWYLYHE